MPKQKINHSTPSVDGFDRFDLVVGWGRDQSVQVGIETPDEGGAGTGQRHLVDYLYADQQEAIGRALREHLHLDTQLAGSAFGYYTQASDWPTRDSDLGRVALDAVTGSSPFGDSVWWHPDRHMINTLIRTLRKARDQAYGSDA